MLGLGNILTKGGALLGFPNKYSFSFDGSNDYLQIADNDSLSFGDGSSDSAFSISAWINPVDATRFSIASKATGSEVEWRFYCDDSDKLQLFLADDSISTNEKRVSTASISQNTWTHVAVTYDGSGGTSASSGINLYINGSLDNGTANGFGTYVAMHNHAIPVNIGFDDYDDKYANGKIDEVAVWNTALSADDVAKIASKPVDFSKASTYATDRTSNLKLWLRAGDKVLPESDASIARSDFYTDFDGTDDYVDCGDGSGLGFSGAEAFSLTAWVNPSSLSSAQIINAFGSDTSSSPEGKRTSLFINSSAKPGLAFWGNDVISDGTVSTNKWVHLVTTFAGGNRTSANTKIYIDGVSQTLTGGTASALDLSDMDFFHIGADQNESQVFNGIISNTSIYKTVLDAQTIKQFAKSRYTPMRDNRFSVVDFDGTDDFIDTGTGLPDITSGAFTISGWFNFDSVSATHWLWGRGTGSGSGYAIKFDTTPRLIAQSKTSSSYQYYASNYTFSVGEWYHITFVHSGTGTTPKLYINGALNAGSGAWNSDIVSQSSLSFKIGSNEGTSNEFNGQIANVAWYSEAKDAEFVYAQYQKGITHNPSADTALEGLWRMGDDTSKAYPTIADSSSNSNDGTMTSMASDDIVQQMISGYDMGAFESSSEELSGEIITNGSFDTDSDWSKGSGWSINTTNGTAVADGTSGFNYLSQSNIFDDANALYKMTITIDACSNFNSGAGLIKNGSVVSWGGGLGISSTGTHTVYFTNSTSSLSIFSDSKTTTISNISVKEVLQSDLSDTYPAIIDVNEPVLGAELFSAWTNGNTGFGAYPAYDSFSFSNGVLNIAGTGSTANMTVWEDISLVANTVYKITYSVSGAIGGGNSSYFRFAFATKALETSLSVFNEQNTLQSDGDKIIYVQATSTATGYYGFRSANQPNLTISNFSIKAVSGNVGTMTQMDGVSNLVYSSVLPDQSFLTGVNSAYNFIDLDGADQYIDCGDGTSLDTTSQLTLSSWVNFDSTGTNVILARDDNTNSNYILYGWSDGKIYAQIQISGVGKTVDGGSYSSDTWYHVVVTFDGSSLKIYVDADLKDTLSASGSIDNDDVSLEIGRKGNNAFHFDGQIGQTAIWNKSLSSTEVGAIYNLGRHGNLLDSYSDNLVGNWAMSSLDSATGLSDSISTVYDRSGNSNHGTPTNADAGDLASSPNAEPNGYAKGDTNRSTTTP